MVKVIPLDSPTDGETKRLGFLAGQIAVPEDFDRIGENEIKQLFDGDE